MSATSRFIKIKDEKRSIKIPVADDKVQLRYIRQFFPEATGLTFNFDGDSCALMMKEEEIDILPSVDTYDVYSPNTPKSNFLSDVKKRRMDEIMGIIDAAPKKGCSSEEKNERKPIFKRKASSTKTIYIGWKHQKFGSNKIKQQIDPFGGVKEVELDLDKKYSIEEIKKIAVAAMKNDRNKFLLEQSDIDLGNFKNQVYDNFYNSEGKICDFWNFVPLIRGSNHTIRIYILSTERKPIVERNENLDENAKKSKDEKKNIDKKEIAPTQNEEISVLSSKKLQTFTNSIFESNVKCSRSDLSSLFPKSKIEFSSSQKSKLKILSMQNSNQDIPKSSNRDIPQSSNQDFPKSSNKDALKCSTNNHLSLSIPIINVNEIKFSDKILGKGAFGEVTKGTWREVDVAVKKICTILDQKSILREIAVMEQIRHPNTISIMAVARETFDCFIVMEFFESCNLRELIYQASKKEMMQFEMEKINKKNYISIQVVKAIAFLHASEIIHKDIKLDNVLINKHYFIKICDFGLSKLSTLPSALATTLGHNVKGTPLYMAPEVILHNKPGEAAADVWAVACLLVEIYSEKMIWPLKYFVGIPVLDMKLTLKNFKKPDLSLVPNYLKSALNACFEMDPINRATIRVLLDIYKSLDENLLKF